MSVTAGILVIGDEILKGETKDTNSVYAAKKLDKVGVEVCKITIIRDNVEDISREISVLSKTFDIVITCGGIGPTHDDITYDGVAKAFNDVITLNPEMSNVVQNLFPDSNNSVLKMAMIPKTSQLVYILPKQNEDAKSFPIVRIANVYILPGIPKWFEYSFDYLLTSFKNVNKKLFKMNLRINVEEFQILDELNKTVRQYEEQVVIGCYPGTHTRIRFESSSIDHVTSAYKFLLSLLPKMFIEDGLRLEDAEDVYDLAEGCEALSLALSHSLTVIENALTKFNMNQVYLSFNGGKDCTVLLHLLWAVLTKKHNKQHVTIKAIYIQGDEPFSQVEHFIQSSCDRYHLQLVTVNGPIKAALEQLVEEDRSFEAVLMGTRRSDPYSSNLQDFQMCDPGWPELMRVNPILDWSYEDVWTFLRLLNIPYCSLYDEGYTSLGNMKNTVPNPALSGNKGYSPAYNLADGSLERQGRTTSR